jgi:hypothetical protein
MEESLGNALQLSVVSPQGGGSPTDGANPSGSPAHRWQHPPSFYCPVSQQVMHDPVVLCDGHTYERRYIERWLQEHNTSPVSGLQLPQRDIYPNHALRNAIEEYFQQVFSLHRRAIRKTIARPEAQENLGSNAAFLRTIDALMHSSLLMNADLSTEQVLQQIMGEAKALVGAEAASVFLIDASGRHLYSTVNSLNEEIRIPVTAGIAGSVATTGDPVIIHDAYSDSRFNKKVDLKTGFRTRNIMCVPLKVRGGTVIGVVQLINKSGDGVLDVDEPSKAASTDSFTMDDLRFLQVFASQAAQAIANSGALDDQEACVSTSETPSSDEADRELDKSLKSGAGHPERGTLTLPGVATALSRRASKESPECNSPCMAHFLSETCFRSETSDCHSSERFFATPCEEAGALLSQAFDQWQFDAVALSEITGNRPLSSLGCFLFVNLELVEHFGLDRVKLSAFLEELELGYDDANQYHNRKHAASVMHAMHALLHCGGFDKVAAKAFEGVESSKELGQMACLLAAAMHDYQHKGLSNDFLVRMGDPRALCYNDQHVNEHHHVAAAFALLLQPDLNFLSRLPSDVFSRMRRVVIDLVLGTDMADSNRILQSFAETLDRLDADQDVIKLGQHEPATAKEATLFLQVAMKCADVGHLTLDWRSHVWWVNCLEEEFFAQGDREKALGLPVSFLMDRQKPGPSQTQVGFFEYVVLPLFRTLVRAAPAAEPMLEAATSNYKMWLDLDEAKRVAAESLARSSDQEIATGGCTYEVASEIAIGSICGGSSSGSRMTSKDVIDGIRSEPCAGLQAEGARQKRSGRARPRAAKWWAKVRCRTPSPDSVFES